MNSNFQHCLELARAIVARYRSEAPEGCDPQNSYVALAGAVIGLGTTVYSSVQKSGAEKDAASARLAPGALGTVPKAAEYVPVDFTQEEIAANQANLTALGKGSSDLAREANARIDTDALLRARKFIPGYEANMKLEGQNANDLLSGRLPYDDVLDIVSNRSGISNALGTPGGGAPTTFRDLGLSRLDAMKSGAGILQNMVGIADTVNPISRRSKAADFFVNPIDRIRLTMDQHQLEQQSLQNKYNLEAQVPGAQIANAQLGLNSQLNPPAGTDYSSIGGGATSLIGAIMAAYKQGQQPAVGSVNEFGGTYEGKMDGMPVYAPQAVSSIPA